MPRDEVSASRILIVDDQVSQMQALCTTLRDEGYETVGVTGGNAALASLREGRFDLLLTDLTMPEMDGISLLKSSLELDPNLVAILMTGEGTIATAVEAMKVGALDYILKPFDLSFILPVLSRALTVRRLRVENSDLRQRVNERTIQLEARTKEVSEMNASLEQRIAERTADLERANGMLQKEMQEREKAEKELRQTQRLEAIGRLAGGVSHDFNNLLGVILGQSEILLDRQHDVAITRGLEMIMDSAKRGATLTRQLLAFGRRQVLETKILNLNTVLTDVEKLLRRVIGEDIELEFKTDAALASVEADPGQMEQVILNLAINARDAMPMGGKLAIATANVDLDEAFADHRVDVRPGSYVQLVVSDTGCGMDEQTLSRIFEPYFTTKEQGKGTGLGLATVYGIVKQSGGYIWVYSEPGLGTTFRIYLPMVSAVARADVPVSISEGSFHGSETILVVEDDSSLREVTCEFLRGSGYTILQAGSPEEALRIAEQHKGPIDFLLTDVIMPGMNGRELATRLSVSRAQIKVLYVSGYTDGVVRDGVHGVLEPGLNFLQKPYTRFQLTRRIREVLDPSQFSSVAGPTG
jgi:signal transduction histidine kinase